VSLNLFEGFEFRKNSLVVSYLQYVDDTLCIGKTTINNLWTVKELLQGFEMVLRMKIDFFKSSLVRVSIPSDFMTMVCDFLSCSKGSLPFKYLAILVGANPNVNVGTNDGSFEYEIEYVKS